MEVTVRLGARKPYVSESKQFSEPGDSSCLFISTRVEVTVNCQKKVERQNGEITVQHRVQSNIFVVNLTQQQSVAKFE